MVIGPIDQYVYWADEILVPHQNVRHDKTEDDCTYPRADETLDSLLGRKLNELGTTEGNATDVGENVISNDQGCWEEKPDHSLENVIHDEMGLYDNEVEGHMRPGKLGKLEAVMTFLQRANKEHEPCKGVSRILTL